MSNFCDQADTHIFSDWLLTYCLGEGVEDLDEFYLGLPDLSELIDRTGQDPKIHWQRIEALWKQSEMPLKDRLAKLWPGIHLVDLGAGRSDLSLAPRILSKLCGVKSYTAVESEHSWPSESQSSEWSGIEMRAIQLDFIDYLKNSSPQGRTCYLLCGIEVKDSLGERAEGLREELLKLLIDKSNPGDLVLFGAGTTELELPTNKFRILYSDPQHFLWQKRSVLQQKILSWLHI